MNHEERKAIATDILGVLQEIGLGLDEVMYAVFDHKRGEDIAAELRKPMPEPTRANREHDTQPLPTDDNLDLPMMHDLVSVEMAATMESRKAIGIERYGQPLRPFNGRDAHVDAWEELADLAVYMRQAQFEVKEMRRIINIFLASYEADLAPSDAFIERARRAVRINTR